MNTTYIFNNGQYTLQVIFYSDKIVRTVFADGNAELDGSMIVVAKLPDSADAAVRREDSDSECRLSTDYLRAIIDKQSLSVRFEDKERCELSELTGCSLEKYDIFKTTGGKIETRQTVDGLRTTLSGAEQKLVGSSNHGRLTITFTEDETLYGLGSHEEGYASLKGQFVPMYQENMRIVLPYMVSTKGYAYLFDCSSLMTFDATDRRYGRFYLDSVDKIDCYFISGDNFDDICRGYRTLTGVTPMLPKWAVGYIQSRERYVSQDDLLATARKYRELQVPIDCIIQDWQYWDNYWGYKHFDPERYPDPKAMTDELHSMDMHMMISIWPNMSGDSADRLELERAGKLLGDGSVYNAFDEEARKIYWRQANEQLFQYGIDGWWCDSSEPFDAVWGGSTRPPLPERMKKSTDEFKKYLDDRIINSYSLMHSKGIYDGQRSVSDKRVINLTRSGFPGQHRYGTIVWSGDISANWETLRKQIHIAQNYIACGEAYWNSDIGAFFVCNREQWFWDGDYKDGNRDLGFRELYTRWLQFACFTPFMRSHGTDTPREVWCFGERGTPFRDSIEKFIQLRYTLMPYFYSLNAAVTFDGKMPLKPLALEFPNDRSAAVYSNEYIYGHEFLVCPVTRPMYYGANSTELLDSDKTVDVYLPEGGWYDYFTEEYYDGRQLVHIDCPIDCMPLFVRAGSIIPTAPVMQSTNDTQDTVYTVNVYEGADGSFTLYSDAGDGYGYENGEYSLVTIRLDGMTSEITQEYTGNGRFCHPITYRKVKKI